MTSHNARLLQAFIRRNKTLHVTEIEHRSRWLDHREAIGI